MNQDTARHLNQLHKAASPVTLKESSEGIILQPAPAAIIQQIKAIVGAHDQSALVAEIREAAGERRAAHTHVSFGFFTGLNNLPAGAAKILCSDLSLRAFRLALPQIRAAIDTYNVATQAAYESYRIACEQGVAVPPPSASEDKEAK